MLNRPSIIKIKGILSFVIVFFVGVITLNTISYAACVATSSPTCEPLPGTRSSSCLSTGGTVWNAVGQSCYPSSGGGQWCCHDYHCNESCGGGSTPTPTPTPSCSNSDPSTPVLVSPADNYACFTNTTIVLDWNGVDFGRNCAGNTNVYRVFVDGTNVSGDIASSTTEYSYTGTWGTSHTWYVQASNGARTSTSATRTFNVSACAGLIGKVWEDLDNNNTWSGNLVNPYFPEAWSWSPAPSGPASPCSVGVDNDINIRQPIYSGGLWINAWGCDAGGSYYTTNPFSLNGAPDSIRNLQVELITPDGLLYPGFYSSYLFRRCTVNGTCIPWTPDITGDGAIATVPISATNGSVNTNHLWWRIRKNEPPTATISSAYPIGTHTSISALGQTIYYVPANTVLMHVASSATDTRSRSNSVTQGLTWSAGISRRPFDPITRVSPTDAASYVVIGANNSCITPTCNVQYNTAVPTSYGNSYFVYYPVARDEVSANFGAAVSNQCNGHPGVHPISGLPTVTGWADCDPNHTDGYQDELVVYGDSLPVCSTITGPTTMYRYPYGQPYSYPESVGWFNFLGSDLDRTEVGKTWNPAWTNTDGLFPQITNITVWASGQPHLGIFPNMQIWLGNNLTGVRTMPVNGSRTVSNLYTVSNPNYQAYTVSGNFNNVSSIDVMFTNNAGVIGDDRNLYIDRVEVTYEVKPGQPLTKTLRPYTEANTGAVYYDRGNNFSQFVNGYDDGAAGNVLSSQVTASGAYGAPAGLLAWSGSYSFPVPIRASDADDEPSIRATPRAFPTYFNDGNLCAEYVPTVLANPTYTVEGTMYQRNASLACIAQGVSSTRVADNGVILTDTAGTPIPGLTTTTDSNGFYRIQNVPLYYRPDPVTGLGGAKVCLDQAAADTGLYVAACSKMEPPVSSTNNPWSDAALCSATIITTPDITHGSTATVNLGFDWYQNEKWSTVLDGDVYAPGMTFDIAEITGLNSNITASVVNRRVDSGGSITIGGFAFVDDLDVDLGLPINATNLSEAGGYARALRDASNTYNFKDKWIVDYNPVVPEHPDVEEGYDPINGNHYRFSSDKVYSYNLEQFNNWYTDDLTNEYYDITGLGKIAIIYVIDDPASGDVLTLNRLLHTQSNDEMLLIITNMPVEVSDELRVPEALLSGNIYNVNSNSNGSGVDALSDGYLDFVILSTNDIEFLSRYDDTVDPPTSDLPIMIHGALISKTGVGLNRDLWHQYNSDYPAEMVRYYNLLLPEIMKIEYSSLDVPSFTGLSTFDVQTVYE